MGCCLAAVISAMPPLASSNVHKMARTRDDKSEEEHVIEMGENAAGNYAASTSSDSDEDHSTSKAPAPAVATKNAEHSGCLPVPGNRIRIAIHRKGK